MIKIESTTATPEQVASVLANAKLPGKKVDPSAQDVQPSSKIVPDPETVGPKSKTAAPVEEPDEDDGEETLEVVSTEAGSTNPAAGNVEKKKGGYQKKIDKLTKRASLAEQEREYWRKQAMEYQAQKPAPAAEPVAQVEPQKSAGEPKPENFKTHADYVKALAKYEWETYEKAAENKANFEKMKAAREKQISDHNSRVAEYVKSVPDFTETLHQVDDIDFTPAMADIILNHDRGPELMYALAKDPENYERISKLPALSLAREIGKLEARLEAPAQSTQKTTEIKTTSAPRPIKAVAAAAPPGKKPGFYEGMPLKEFREWRRSQGAND